MLIFPNRVLLFHSGWESTLLTVIVPAKRPQKGVAVAPTTGRRGSTSTWVPGRLCLAEHVWALERLPEPAWLSAQRDQHMLVRENSKRDSRFNRREFGLERARDDIQIGIWVEGFPTLCPIGERLQNLNLPANPNATVLSQFLQSVEQFAILVLCYCWEINPVQQPQKSCLLCLPLLRIFHVHCSMSPYFYFFLRLFEWVKALVVDDQSHFPMTVYMVECHKLWC